MQDNIEIYNDLHKMLKRIKKISDIDQELASVLTVATIDAHTKITMEGMQIDRTEALQIARINVLQIFDEFIFSDRMESME